ncbi:MAG: hypothetical protein ACRDTC_20420 [Pseudonocardiaceae bacterium]
MTVTLDRFAPLHDSITRRQFFIGGSTPATSPAGCPHPATTAMP